MNDQYGIESPDTWGIEHGLVDDEPFEIHRRTSLYGIFTLVPLVLAAGFAWFAYGRGELWLWAPVAVLVVLALVALPGITDGRTPLFVADHHGVRLRDRDRWVGLLWSELADVRIEPREGRHDARVKVISPDGQRIFAAPLGFTTSTTAEDAEEQLARRRPGAAYTESS